MSFLVFCTFDLKNASSQDYRNAYSDLASLGLKKVQKSDKGRAVVIPTTSVMGQFSGSNAEAVGDAIFKKVKAKFENRRFDSEIFVVVGDDWAWTSGTT